MSRLILLFAVLLLVAAACETTPKAADLGRLTDAAWAEKLKNLDRQHDLDLAAAKAAHALDLELATEANESRLGREAGRRSIANAASWVGLAGKAALAFAIVGAVFTAFSGGIAYRRWAIIAGIAGACWLGQYFITVHGYLVSESFSWAALVAFYLVLGGAILWGCLTLYARWNAGRLIGKRALSGDDGRDGIALLPTTRRAKSAIADAWETVRKCEEGTTGEWYRARNLLLRHGLKEPAVKA